MRILQRNTIAAMLVLASTMPFANAEPASQAAGEKIPIVPSGGRGNDSLPATRAKPDEKPVKDPDKPRDSKAPSGGRGNTEATEKLGMADAEREAKPQKDREGIRTRGGQDGPGDERRAAKPDTEKKAGALGTGQSVDDIVATWPERPRLGARILIAKYGQPDSVTAKELVWYDQGQFKRICVSSEEHHHDFPKPHTDFMKHTIAYEVAADKAGEITKYDGSVTFDRTQGEMSARCDVETHNILSLNLANDIFTGKLDADKALEKFGEIVVQEAAGEKPAYLTRLQFEPAGKTAPDADEATIAGASQREMSESGKPSGDSEVLGSIVAVDESEMSAAWVAAEKKLGPEVAEYAKMIHKMHSENLAKTMALGIKTSIVPTETPAVDSMRKKNAGNLAKIVELDGSAFSDGFINLMVAGHTEVLATIDSKLMNAVKNEEVVEHLKATRGEVATHLAEAKKLQVTAQR